MKMIKLLAIAALSLCAFGAVGTAIASAEEDLNPPQLLCLVAKCQELSGTLKGGASKLVTLKGARTLAATGVELLLGGCEAVAGTGEKDILLCKDVPIHFSGVGVEEEGKVGSKCKTEGDEAGVVLLLLDLHMSDETSETGELQALILFHILNAKKELVAIILTCGVLKMEVKGTIGCLTLGLKNIQTTEEIAATCALNGKDPKTGTCKLLCELLEKNPFLANLGGGFEDAWMEINGKGKLNKDIFIDD